MSHRVKSAEVHANSLTSATSTGRLSVSQEEWTSIFSGLSELPRLTSLTVELNYHVLAFPVSCLTKILSSYRLQRLHLKHLQFVGTVEEIGELMEVVREQTQLQHLTLEYCRGVSSIQALVQRLPSLQSLKVTTTPLAPYGTLPESALLDLLTPSLQTLKLDDVPEVDNGHIQQLCQALGKNSDVALQEFSLISNMLSGRAVRHVVKMMQTNRTIQKLVLHVDSEHMGTHIAKILQHNSCLKSMDIRMYNDAASLSENAVLMARALQYHNKTLMHLKLRLEIEVLNLPRDIVAAFSLALDNNTTLQTLSMEDGTYRYSWPQTMKLQLALNASGIPQLLQSSSSSTADLANTLIEQKDNLNVTFFLLSNMPNLLFLDQQQEEDTVRSVTRTMSASSASSGESKRRRFSGGLGGGLKKHHSNGWKLPLAMRRRSWKLSAASA